MHQSRESVEIVLQEVCVQHLSSDTMKREMAKITPETSSEKQRRLSESATLKSEKPIVIEPLK